MRKAESLLPCPFCSGQVRLVVGQQYGVAMIHCEDCHATMSFGGRERADETVRAYNHRAALLTGDTGRG